MFSSPLFLLSSLVLAVSATTTTPVPAAPVADASPVAVPFEEDPDKYWTWTMVLNKPLTSADEKVVIQTFPRSPGLATAKRTVDVDGADVTVYLYQHSSQEVLKAMYDTQFVVGATFMPQLLDLSQTYTISESESSAHSSGSDSFLIWLIIIIVVVIIIIAVVAAALYYFLVLRKATSKSKFAHDDGSDVKAAAAGPNDDALQPVENA